MLNAVSKRNVKDELCFDRGRYGVEDYVVVEEMVMLLAVIFLLLVVLARLNFTFSL